MTNTPSNTALEKAESAACESSHGYPATVHSKPCFWPVCDLTCKGRGHRLSAYAAISTLRPDAPDVRTAGAVESATLLFEEIEKLADRRKYAPIAREMFKPHSIQTIEEAFLRIKSTEIDRISDVIRQQSYVSVAVINQIIAAIKRPQGDE